ncbi:DNA primase [Fusobacterium sp.]|uniref:DNA primase n=1 Tax=Fusobacterium sp. TaxID=68766 RepID=UPI00262EFF4D|nr:DNA primase [Fusobacterium sp.]
MKYRMEDIDNLINQLKIEEVVGEVVELKKSGANYKGLCPFHQDTTPSFSVSPSKNICKCFSCGAGGNPVKFYSEYYKVSFEEAAEQLAEKYNIPLKAYKKNNRQEEENSKYYKIMNEAHRFFQDKIFENEGRVALDYLAGRGVTPKFIKENELGYAPNGWNDLYDYLVIKGFEKEDIIALGLVKDGDKGIYDAFRNRIMFPIYSPQGSIIAFGGRTLETSKEVPKYINSPDTPIFKKGKNLYGIKEKGNILRKKNYTLLMEGYMDVLSAHLYGFDVALASLGTAFTLEQGQLLKRYTNNVILSLDMDKAGQMATEKTAFILKNLGFNIRVLNFQNAKDPDEFLKKYGKEEFLKSVKNSLEIFDFLYELYSKEYDLSNIMSKQKFIERFKEFFQNVESSLEKTLYLDKLSKAINIEKSILQNILIDNNNYKEMKTSTYVEEKELKSKNIVTNTLEDITIELILADISYYEYFRDKDIEVPLYKKLFTFLESLEETEKKNNQEKIIKEFINSEELSSVEKDKLSTLNMYSLTDYSDIKKRENDLKEIFVSWFRKELKEVQEVRENIMVSIMLKRIEAELYLDLRFDEILEKYKKFKNILLGNNIL